MTQNNIFDTFDEGIIPGGMRTKTEIKMLICYIFRAVNKPLSKEIVVNTILEKALANYFEACSCFDDLVNLKNLKKCDSDKNLFELTSDGKWWLTNWKTPLPIQLKKKHMPVLLNFWKNKGLKKKIRLQLLLLKTVVT